MRYIRINELEERGNWPPEQWRVRACKAEQELRNLPAGKNRADIFNKYSDLWSALKQDFSNLSHGKCWYCEVSTDGMRGDMDHHRPKGKVTENPDHPGYWWLAFDWRNFRFSCERCNSLGTDPETGVVGGKQNFFPLVNGDESQRILDECEYQALFLENPLLLDPTEPGDPRLVSFESDGRPRPESTDEESVDYQRAQRSIEIYNLYHSFSNRKRRTIYSHINSLLNEYKIHHAILGTNPADRAARLATRRIYLELGDLIGPRAEYSSAAKAYLNMKSSTEPEGTWINGLLLTAS